MIPSCVVDRYVLRHNTRRCRHCRAEVLFHTDHLGLFRVLDVKSARPEPALGAAPHPTHVRLDVHRPHCPAFKKTPRT